MIAITLGYGIVVKLVLSLSVFIYSMLMCCVWVCFIEGVGSFFLYSGFICGFGFSVLYLMYLLCSYVDVLLWEFGRFSYYGISGCF